MTDINRSDQAFRKKDIYGRWTEMTYGGALSFLRRPYQRDLSGIDVAITGIPYDGAVTYRPGARFGPRAIRAASVQLAELRAFPFGFDPFDSLAVIDYGDCAIDPHHPDTIIPTIQSHLQQILSHNVIPLSFGGDHFVTYPILKAIANKHGPVALLHFDAHCDTWADDGNCLNHGTMFLRAKKEDLIDVSQSCQIGLRTYNDQDHGFKILTAHWVLREGAQAVIEVVQKRLGNHPVYLTFDMDCLDPAFAPGTGTPVAAGLTPALALEIIRSLDCLNLVGADVVEVSPAYDVSEITALNAATIAHDILCLMALKKGAKPCSVGLL